MAEDSAEAEGVVPTDDGAEASQVDERLKILVISELPPKCLAVKGSKLFCPAGR